MHPGARPVGLLILLFLLIPSAAYLWQHDDLPQFCDFHDDCIYYVSAKSLADGGGYRIESLPGEPSQTKYPPLYPLLLSVAWRINPRFPYNLPIAAWLSWLAFPAILILFSAYSPKLGLAGWRAWVVLVLLAVNPYLIWFSSQLLSELLFLALVLATLALVEQCAGRGASPTLALVAGAVSGLAYLARSAGIVMLPAAFLYLWIRKERRSAMYFAGTMLPFVVIWTVWVRLRMPHTTDPTLIYYTDYFGYQLYNVKLADLHLYLWKNLDGLLLGLGSLILPKVTGSLFLKILAQVIAVAMISGVVRMVRRGYGLLYALFALGTSALFLVWHYPPDERFVLPLFPLGLAGLVVEMEHLGGMLRAGLHHPDRSQRVAAGAMITAVIGIFGGCLALQLYVGQVYMPEDARQHRRRNVDYVAAYGWMRVHVPSDAAVFAHADPLLYLYTGRHATSHPLLPRLWYREDRAGVANLLKELQPFAREHDLKYYFYTEADLNQALEDSDRLTIDREIRANPDLEEEYRKGAVTVYRFAN